MRIKQAVQKVPGGMMVVPLMLGALLNTIDQAQIAWIVAALKWLGVPATAAGRYEFLRIGGFTEALFKNGAAPLIALFLFCVGGQMDLRIGGRAVKKGILITGSKYAVGVAVGYLFALLSDPLQGFLGLSALAIIAAMTNSNGGMYAALTGEYGNHSDVGALAILSLNDGPFLTMLALGILGERFPAYAFISVLVPIGLGMLLGNLDPDLRAFLKRGERVAIPFFAFALGAHSLDFGKFLDPAVVGGGVVLGAATVIFSAITGILVLRVFRERSQIAAVAEASTAGNAVMTPVYIAGVVGGAAYAEIASVAAAQISISTLTTAVLCPVAVIAWSKFQRRRGIDARAEFV